MSLPNFRVTKDPQEIERLSPLSAEAPVTQSGQHWGVIVYVGPAAHQKCEHFAINFISAFPTAEDAQAYCKKLQTQYNWDNFTTYVIPMNKLLPFPPPNDKEMERHYPSTVLNQLMDQQKEEMFKSEDRIDGRLSELHKIESEKQLRMRSPAAIEAERKLFGPDVKVAEIDSEDEKSTHIAKVHCLMGRTQTERPVGAKIIDTIELKKNTIDDD